MTPTTSNFRIALASTISLTEIDGKLVLFSKDTGDFFGLNETALFLLKKLLETDFSQTVSEAARQYDVPEHDISQDLMELVTDLEKKKLLKKISD